MIDADGDECPLDPDLLRIDGTTGGDSVPEP